MTETMFLSISIGPDIFAIDHSCGHNLTSDAALTVVDCMSACTKGVLAVMDRDRCLLNRMWCLFECGIALRRYGHTKFHMAIAGEFLR